MRLGRSVAASSITIGISGLVGQAAAFATTFLLASLFGAGREMDAFAATIAIPYYVVALVQASVNKAFVPVFVRELQNDRDEPAWRFAGGSTALLAGILAVLAVTGFALVTPIVEALFPHFSPETREIAIRLGRVALPGCLPLGLATYLVSLHMARRGFLVGSLAQALQPIGGLVSLLLFQRQMGILALPVGVVGGAAFQCALLATPLLRRVLAGGVARWHEDALSRFRGFLLPLLLAAVFSKAFPLLERVYGTLLPPGSISHMAYGWKFVAFLFFLITNGIHLASLTYVSETTAGGDRDELRLRSAAIARGMLHVLLPVVTAAFVFRLEAMSIFVRGAFTAEDARQASIALALYLPLLMAFSLQGVVNVVFFALGRVRTVAIVSAISLATYVVLAPLLAKSFGMPGLVTAFGVSVSVAYAIYLVLLRPLVGGLEGRSLLVALARGIAGAAATGVGLEVVRRGLAGPLLEGHLLVRAALLGALGVAGCVPYVLVVWLLGDRELIGVLNDLRRKKGTAG